MKKLAYIIVAGLSLGLLAGIASAQAGNIRPSQINPCPTNGEVLSTVAGTTSCTAQSSLGFVQTNPGAVTQTDAQGGGTSLIVTSTGTPLFSDNTATALHSQLAGFGDFCPNLSAGFGSGCAFAVGVVGSAYNFGGAYFNYSTAAGSLFNYMQIAITGGSGPVSGLCTDGNGFAGVNNSFNNTTCGDGVHTLFVNGTVKATSYTFGDGTTQTTAAIAGTGSTDGIAYWSSPSNLSFIAPSTAMGAWIPMQCVPSSGLSAPGLIELRAYLAGNGSPCLGFLPAVTTFQYVARSALTTSAPFYGFQNSSGAGEGSFGFADLANAKWVPNSFFFDMLGKPICWSFVTSGVCDVTFSATGAIAMPTGSTVNGSAICTTATGCGGGGISGLTSGYIPLAGSATTITGNSHMDDGVTSAGKITSSEPIVSTSGISLFVGIGVTSLGSSTTPICQASSQFTVAGCTTIVGGTGTFTTATSDNISVTNVNTGDVCTFSPTNSIAANVANVLGYISAVGTGSITITHAATTASGGTVAVTCKHN